MCCDTFSYPFLQRCSLDSLLFFDLDSAAHTLVVHVIFDHDKNHLSYGLMLCNNIVKLHG